MSELESPMKNIEVLEKLIRATKTMLVKAQLDLVRVAAERDNARDDAKRWKLKYEESAEEINQIRKPQTANSFHGRQQ